MAWVGKPKPAPPASNDHLRRIGPTGFGDGEVASAGVACVCLAACFSWLLAGLSRWPLSMHEMGGASASQCHDDDDERGARDGDLFAGARGSAWSGPPANDRVGGCPQTAMF